MSRSVDPADRNRTIALISLQGDQFPRSALYLGCQQDFPGGFDDRGLKGSDEKMRHDFTQCHS